MEFALVVTIFFISRLAPFEEAGYGSESGEEIAKGSEKGEDIIVVCFAFVCFFVFVFMVPLQLVQGEAAEG